MAIVAFAFPQAAFATSNTEMIIVDILNFFIELNIAKSSLLVGRQSIFVGRSLSTNLPSGCYSAMYIGIAVILL